MKKRILLHIPNDQAILNIESWPGIFARLSAIAPADEHVPGLTDEEEKLVEEKLAQEIDQGDTNPIEALLSVVAVNLQDSGYELYLYTNEYLPSCVKNKFHGIITTVATDIREFPPNTSILWELAINNGKLDTADGCDWALSKARFLKEVAENKKEVAELTMTDQKAIPEIPDISGTGQKTPATLADIKKRFEQLKMDKATNILPMSQQIGYLGRRNNSLYLQDISQVKRQEIIELYQQFVKDLAGLLICLDKLPDKQQEWETTRSEILSQREQGKTNVNKLKRTYKRNKSLEKPPVLTLSEIKKKLLELKQYKENEIKPTSQKLQYRQHSNGKERTNLKIDLLQLLTGFTSKINMLKYAADAWKNKDHSAQAEKEWETARDEIYQLKKRNKDSISKLKVTGVRLRTDAIEKLQQPASVLPGQSAETTDPFSQFAHSSVVPLRSTKRSAAPATITSEQAEQKAKRPKLN